VIKKIKDKIRITLWLIKIGNGFLSKINLLRWLYLPTNKKDVCIKFKAFGQTATLTLPNNRDQLLTFRSIFLYEDWYVDKKIDPETVFDLGSYTGISVMYFLLKYPKSKVYAFEPDIETYKYLSENYKGNTRVIYSNMAIAGTNGKITLYKPNGRALSSSIMPRGNLQSTTVESKTFDNICTKIKQIDLLKFNIEGGEINIFETKSFVEKVNVFIGEVHGDLISQPLSPEKFKEDLSKYFDIKVIKITKKQRAIWFGKSKKLS
jgi:FkbM family methyltransferase